jgi:hypothetical protein
MCRRRSALAIAFLAISLLVGSGTGMTPAPARAQETPAEATPAAPEQAAPPQLPVQPQSQPPAPAPTQPQSAEQPRPAQPPEFGDPRFAFHRIDDAFARLDLRTGAVASCRQQASGWACVAAPDERAAFDSEIARLQRETAVLKNALLEHGVPLPNGMAADAPSVAVAPPPAESIPRPPQSVPPVASAPQVSPPKSAEADRAARDDAELERIMNVMEKVWRRLVEMMMNVQRDMQRKG